MFAIKILLQVLKYPKNINAIGNDVLVIFICTYQIIIVRLQMEA